MNHIDFHKSVKQDKKSEFPRLNIDESKKTEGLPLQISSTPFSFLWKKKRVFSYLQANHAQSGLIFQQSDLNLSKEMQPVLQQNWKKVEGVSFSSLFDKVKKKPKQRKIKKKILTPSLINKKTHIRTLSESFVNLIMVDGKKSKAEKIFSQALKKLTRHLEGAVFDNVKNIEGENKIKREITLFGKKEKESLLILKDGLEKRNVHDLIERAIENVKPILQVRKVRVARSVYQVPFIMRKERQERSAIRWIIESAKKKSRHSRSSFPECLAQVVLEGFMGQGQVREKRNQLHRTAEANRTYLRYRWW